MVLLNLIKAGCSMKNLSSSIIILTVLILSGCAAPSTTIKSPLTARPVSRDLPIANNGAIFQAGRNERPLFEDKHARNVGDTLTINIAETVSASQSANNSSSHAGSFTASTPTISRGAASTGGPSTAATLLAPINISDSSTGALSDKTANDGANKFTGTITVTVVEVMPNGNLMVGGEKLIAINHNNGYVRFSGVVDPATIVSTTTGFTVQSTLVADVHMEYKDSDNNLDKSQIMSTLGRAFLSILPF
jgi:flagellar L-ring protein precursor FlgH